MKGQSAIEYLMTYGWMLLVVAIVGGAVFSLVQGQAIESVSGFSGTEVNINDFGMNSDDELMLSMRNTAADEVQIKAVELEDPETGATTKVLSGKDIGVGDSQTVTVDGFERTSSSNKQNLKIIYGSGGLEDQVVEGTITGKLKAKNHVYLQNAVFNRSTNTLNITAQNTGNTEADVDYAVNSDSNSFTGSPGTLASGETQYFIVNTDETFPLQNVSLNVDGQYFSNSQKQLKCTPTKGLVGYWTMDQYDITEDKIQDMSQYDNWGELIGGVRTQSEGLISGSLDFDADISNPDYIQLSKEVNYEPSNGFTVVGLINRDSDDAGWDPQPSRRGIYEDDLIEIDQKRNSNIAILVDGGGVLGDVNENEFSYPANQWTLVGVTYDGQSLSMWRNDNIIDTEQVSNLPSSQEAPRIGANLYSAKRSWGGDIDELRIYNHSLGSDKINGLLNLEDYRWAVDACKLTN